ncbi:3-deoxy-manno-octulosonate cytidylyltransferase [Sphingomonas sp.]|uniref:3-deoxy-manno-octulosonate cytidylyltransferase n=1 Tax=Sphingomonas sp. TaxID=28214 RepID=UPI003B0090D7
MIVVPARHGSTRLRGKPLVAIAGRTLLDRVTRVARAAAALAGDAEVVVATDDERIMTHARELGVAAMMTSPAIASGSGRAYAAAISRDPQPRIVVNLQGDAPFVPPAMVAALLAAMRQGEAAMATPVVRLDWPALDALRAQKAIAPFSGTTCVRGEDGSALWFSKTIIPAIRDEPALRAAGDLSPVWQHVGLYAYRLDALAAFEAAPPSTYERLEGLEQLRFLELGMGVMTVAVERPPHAMGGIDAPADVARAEASIARHGDPYEA